MKKNQNKDKKYPQNSKKKRQGTIHIIPVKKNVPIKDNNSTIFNFFKVSSTHKSSSTNIVPETRQTILNLNKDKDKTESKKNYKLSKYYCNKSENKNNNLIKKLTKNTEENENENKIDVSEFILFNDNFSNEINTIFINNFIRSFKRYIDEKNRNENSNIGFSQKFNLSKITFNKFIQQTLKNFINKYLLNTYHNLIYVPEKYMINKNKQNDLNEIGLLSYKDKSDILLEYSPINLSECNLFYPDLCSNISKFIKIFKIKKRKNRPNRALLLYRPNKDFIAYINKIKLICDQLGYRVLVREDEANKLMNIDKLKEINQNYIIGSLQDKNIKYLKILENISLTEKWTNFLEYNNIHFQQNEEKQNKNKQNNKNKNINKTQSTIDTTQKIQIRNNKNKKDDVNILSNNILTYIGHSNNSYIQSQESDKINSNEYKIFQNYKQNILQKFNKRRNVILFVDDFNSNDEKNDENIKYINQINTIIPTSKSPIIILTNNLSIFADSSNNSGNGNPLFHTRYSPCQIENEGINQKENIIYMTFLIMYFIVFIPQANLEKKDNKEKNVINKDKDKDKEKNKELEKELDFVISINDSELSSIDIDNKNYELEKIRKTINNIFVDTKLNSHNNELYSSLITLSNVIAIINNYEIDNILVYLKNILDLIKYKLKDQIIIQNIKQKILLLQNTILLDIEQYKEQNDFSINSAGGGNEDISKISEICENNSLLDYEYGHINNIAEKEYEKKIKNYKINNLADFNKESYFYTCNYCYDYKYSNNCNYINNEEVEERINEDHKFYQNYYNNSNTILNKSDINKLNMILCQIITNDRISLDDISKFIGTRSKRKINQKQNNNSNINFIMNEKISILNKLFRKCPLELFVRYINAHIGFKYYSKFTINENKYSIPEKLLFYNYYNDYYLMEKILTEQVTKYKENEEEEENFDDNDLIDEEEEEEFYEEDDY